MKNYFDFTGKKYLVTGASSGIGRATAISLAEQGALVVLNGRNEQRLEETRSRMTGTGHMIIRGDLCDMDDMTDFFNEMVSDGIKPDGIVHCAGIGVTLPVGMMKKEEFDRTMSINIYALMEMCRLFAKKKYHNETGSIVAVSSLTAAVPGKCQSVYAAAKAGMNAAIQSAAQELAGKKIRINSIMPAFVRTQLYYATKEEIGEQALLELTDKQLLGIPEPEQIAETIMFLLSDASGIITGRAMFVDAGTL